MYLSHPVRRMRDDPMGDETVELIVTAEDEDALDDLETQLLGLGEVEERLRFGSLRVSMPQRRVADACAIDGIESIETATTREMAGGDAGEDVEP
ncbi:hypothetical protein ACKVMT_10210 [Halobacteriales archaeon Cl-PHB]